MFLLLVHVCNFTAIFVSATIGFFFLSRALGSVVDYSKPSARLAFKPCLTWWTVLNCPLVIFWTFPCLIQKWNGEENIRSFNEWMNEHHQEIIKFREWFPHVGPLTKVIPLKLFLGIVPSSSEDATRAMPGQPKRLSRNNLRRRKWRERHFISFDFVL